MSKRPRTPFFRQAHLLPPASSEADAARSLELERAKRAERCLAEVVAVLERHRCAFQIVVQDIFQDGRPPDRRSQVNVVPLETPPAPGQVVVQDSSSPNNGKPATGGSKQ
jgi:hypothetical protein